MHHAVAFLRILIVVLPILISNLGFSQVTIKEKISISPNPPTIVQTAVPSHTLRFEGVWDVPIFARMFTSHCFGRTDTGTSSMTFEVPLTAGGYTFDFQLRVAELQPHQVCNVTLTVKVDGQVVMQQSASFVGGSLAIFALWPGDYPSYGSPYNTTFAFSVGDSILYEEGALPSIAGVNTCDEGLWDPASSVNLQITGGNNYAQFYDYNTRLAKGTSVSGTVQQIQDNYELVADGTIPDSAGAFVTVQATSGGITQTASVKIKPYFFQVSVDSARIDYGSGTAIRVRSVDVDGHQYYRPVMPSVRVRIVDSLAYGTLWYGRNDSSSVRQIGDTLNDVTSLVNAGPFSGYETRFYAVEQQPKDSVNVQIAVEKTGEGFMTDYYPPSAIPFPGRDTVRGATQVTVVVPVTKKLKIVDHSPWEIWPDLVNKQSKITAKGYNPKRSFTVKVVDESQKPIAGESVEINCIFSELTGGHHHNIPVLEQTRQGKFYAQEEKGNPLKDLETDEDGVVTIDSLVASEVSGQYLVTARLASDTTVLDTVHLTVKVPGLRPLPSGSSNLITHTSAEAAQLHRLADSDLGDSSAIAVIQLCVKQYAEEYGMESDIYLAAVDMSLPYGGLFDIKGRWQTPHKWHRTGKSVDFSSFYKDSVGNTTTVEIYIDGIRRNTTNKIDQDFVDKKFEALHFSRKEKPDLIHYESQK